MKKKSLEIIALAILSSLLVSVKIVPVKAAPASKATKTNSEKKIGDTKLFEDTPLFESKKFQIAFITSLSMTALAILIGTGQSIKYNRSKPEEIESNLGQEASKAKSKPEPTAVKSQPEPEEVKQPNYRQIYQDLQNKVDRKANFADDESWEADPWEVDVEIAIAILSESPDDFEKVKLVLSQSDRVREWKRNLRQADYQAKTTEYIQKAYNWAKELEEWRKEKTNVEELSSTNSLHN